MTFGKGEQQPPRGTVLVNPTSGVLLIASNLPALPAGQDVRDVGDPERRRAQARGPIPIRLRKATRCTWQRGPVDPATERRRGQRRARGRLGGADHHAHRCRAGSRGVVTTNRTASARIAGLAVVATISRYATSVPCGELRNGRSFVFIPKKPEITMDGRAMVPSTVSTFIT